MGSSNEADAAKRLFLLDSHPLFKKKASSLAGDPEKFRLQPITQMSPV